MLNNLFVKKPQIPTFQVVTLFLISIVFVGLMAYILYSTNFNTMFLSVLLSFILLLVYVVTVLNNLYNQVEEGYQTNLELQREFTAKLNRTYEGTLRALSSALDLRDHETWGHSARVIGYAMAIGEIMGLTPQDIRILAWGGFLHDIGKIGIKDAVLLKTDRLSAEEWREIRRHPFVGYDMIRQVDFLEESSDIVLFHHEHYDGTGYPMGLSFNEIPLKARIFSIADTFDAMTSIRPYRRARSVNEAVKEIRNQAGKQFCPQCVAAFLKIPNSELMEIRRGLVGMDEMAFMHRVLTPDKSNLEKLNLA